MIEAPPKVELNSKDVIPNMVRLQFDGVLGKIINDYLYWDKIKYIKAECSSQELWAAVKIHRQLRSTRLQFGKYVFTFTLTDAMSRLLHEFDLHIGGNLGSNIGIAETDKAKFMVNSIMEEAISSSQIEGANTTRKRAKEMIRQERRPSNKSERMIMNNFITMKHIVQQKHEPITPEAITYIQKLISTGTLEDTADEGKFRDTDDIYVVDHSKSEVVHIPPDSAEIEKLVEDLCLFFNTDGETFIHPIIKGCIIHFMMGWIHPFADGNGRTARALFYWYMLRHGYWLTEYLSISRIIQDSKAQYERAFLYTETDENDMGYFIHYHLKTMEKAYAALRNYIGRKQQEISQAAAFMKIPGVNDRMAQIIKIIHDDADRVLSTKEIENRFNVSSFTARADLKNLVNMHFLEVIQVNQKKQHFIKSKQFDNLIKRAK